MGLCVAMIAFVRLPSLKVSCLLLSGLLIYDVFWVRPGPARGSRTLRPVQNNHRPLCHNLIPAEEENC